MKRFCCSYDLRKPEKISHWQDKEFNNRAHFRAITEPAALEVERVEKGDEGEYRCRVDFAISPTRNSRVYLTVIGLYPILYNILKDIHFTLLVG